MISYRCVNSLIFLKFRFTSENENGDWKKVEKYYSDGHSGWRTGLRLWEQRAGWGSLATLDGKERWSVLSETGKVSVHSAGPGEMTPKLGCLNLLGKLLVDVNQSGITRELRKALNSSSCPWFLYMCVWATIFFLCLWPHGTRMTLLSVSTPLYFARWMFLPSPYTYFIAIIINYL